MRGGLTMYGLLMLHAFQSHRIAYMPLRSIIHWLMDLLMEIPVAEIMRTVFGMSDDQTMDLCGRIYHIVAPEDEPTSSNKKNKSKTATAVTSAETKDKQGQTGKKQLLWTHSRSTPALE